MSDLAITVWQPFAGLLVSGVKTVENRTWSPRGIRPGDRFLIHAGVRYDRGSWVWVHDLAEELKAKNQWRMFRTPSWPLSASKPNPDADPVGATPYGAIVGAVTLDEVRRTARGMPIRSGPNASARSTGKFRACHASRGVPSP